MSITLIELFKQVKEKHLSKDDLEKYRDELANLFAMMSLELSEIEKEKAIFIDGYIADTDVAKKRKWQITKSGQREIELNRYLKATTVMLSSLKSRLYEHY